MYTIGYSFPDVSANDIRNCLTKTNINSLVKLPQQHLSRTFTSRNLQTVKEEFEISKPKPYINTKIFSHSMSKKAKIHPISQDLQSSQSTKDKSVLDRSESSIDPSMYGTFTSFDLNSSIGKSGQLGIQRNLNNTLNLPLMR